MTAYSIKVRLQRVSIEEAFVSVGVSDAVLEPDPSDPEKLRISGEKLLRAAIELGKLPTTTWTTEGESTVSLHPIQTGRG
jgi:hypothetical protein